jgi:hypothetical protein
MVCLAVMASALVTVAPAVAQSDCKLSGPNAEVCLVPGGANVGQQLHPNFECYWPKVFKNGTNSTLSLKDEADGSGKKFKVRVKNLCDKPSGGDAGPDEKDKEIHVDVVMRVRKGDVQDRLAFDEKCGGGQLEVAIPFKKLSSNKGDTITCKTAAYKRVETGGISRRAMFDLVATGLHVYDKKRKVYDASHDIEVVLDPEIVLEKSGEARFHYSLLHRWFR